MPKPRIFSKLRALLNRLRGVKSSSAIAKLQDKDIGYLPLSYLPMEDVARFAMTSRAGRVAASHPYLFDLAVARADISDRAKEVFRTDPDVRRFIAERGQWQKLLKIIELKDNKSQDHCFLRFLCGYCVDRNYYKSVSEGGIDFSLDFILSLRRLWPKAWRWLLFSIDGYWGDSKLQYLYKPVSEGGVGISLQYILEIREIILSTPPAVYDDNYDEYYGKDADIRSGPATSIFRCAKYSPGFVQLFQPLGHGGIGLYLAFFKQLAQAIGGYDYYFELLINNALLKPSVQLLFKPIADGGLGVTWDWLLQLIKTAKVISFAEHVLLKLAEDAECRNLFIAIEGRTPLSLDDIVLIIQKNTERMTVADLFDKLKAKVSEPISRELYQTAQLPRAAPKSLLLMDNCCV